MLKRQQRLLDTDGRQLHKLFHTRRLRRLQRMAENLGLITLGLVAADLTLCITCQDVTAFSAVWARLVRVAENALADQRSLLGATLA